jgi:hypothetical protein
VTDRAVPVVQERRDSRGSREVKEGDEEE